MTALRRIAATAMLPALGLFAVGLQGCASSSNSPQSTSTPTAAAVKQPGGGTGMARVRPPLPGVKTGDFSGGLK